MWRILKISDVILKLNGEMTTPAVAKEVGVSKDTLSRRLKTVGYEYNNSSKKYEYNGDLNEKGKIDDTDFSTLYNKTVSKKTDKNNKKIINKSDINNGNVLKESDIDNKNKIENNDISLTNDEKLFIKKLCEHQSDIRLSIDFSMLPIRNKTKKHQMEISEKTYNDFEDFAKRMKDKRFSKNDLMEIALVRLMREFN